MYTEKPTIIIILRPNLSEEKAIGNWKIAWVNEKILITSPYDVSVPERLKIKAGNPIWTMLLPRFLKKFPISNTKTKILADFSGLFISFSDSKSAESVFINFVN